MARYIDADKLNTRARGNNSQRTMWREIKRIVDDAPTADVVPKSEVERLKEQVSDLQDELYSETETNKHLSAEYIALSKEKNALNIEVEALKIANEKMYSSIEATKAEIFEEIEEYFGMYNVPIFLTRKNFAELKKKYTVETNEHNERTD